MPFIVETLFYTGSQTAVYLKDLISRMSESSSSD